MHFDSSVHLYDMLRFLVVSIVILWLSGLPGLCSVSEEGGYRPFWTLGTHLPHPLPTATTQFPTTTPTTYRHNSVSNYHTHYLPRQLSFQPPHPPPTATTQFPTATPTIYRHNSVSNRHTHYLPPQLSFQPPHPLPTATTQAITVCLLTALTARPQTGHKPTSILLTAYHHKQDCCMCTVQSGSL
jgi:hypothetical protein